MEASRGAAPLCSSCSHPHFPEEKCPVCGHRGKGRAYLLVAKTTAPSSAELHFECFDGRGDPCVYKSRMALARILRARVFVEECAIPEDQEFDAADASCRHVLGLVGDAPVLYARWRIEEGAAEGGAGGSGSSGGSSGSSSSSNGGPAGATTALAVIDRLAILPAYRGRKFASAALEFLLQDVEATTRDMQRWVAGVAVTVPVDLRVMGEKLRDQRGFEVVGDPYQERNATFVRMVLLRATGAAAAPPAAGGASAVVAT